MFGRDGCMAMWWTQCPTSASGSGMYWDFNPLLIAVHLRERAQMGRQHNPDHGRVWTSTDSTAGRSLTIGAQVSPLSAEP